MKEQERPDNFEVFSQTREANDVPESYKTKNGGDDDAAETSDKEDRSLAAESARPWRVAKSLLVLRDQVNAMAPNRRKASDGFIGDAAHASRNSDHNPWVLDGGVGVVTAFDVTHDPARGCDADELVEALRAGLDPRIKYIIWNRRIANSSPIGGQPAWAWRPYSGTNPHTAHAHISVKPDKVRYDAAHAWPMPT